MPRRLVTFYSSGRSNTRKIVIGGISLNTRPISIYTFLQSTPFTQYQISMSAYFFSESRVSSVVSTLLPNGNVSVVCSAVISANSYIHGNIYDEDGIQITGSFPFGGESYAIYGSGSVTAFDGGNVFLSYVDRTALTTHYVAGFDENLTNTTWSYVYDPNSLVSVNNPQAIHLSNDSVFMVKTGVPFLPTSIQAMRNYIYGSNGYYITSSEWAVGEIYTASIANMRGTTPAIQMTNGNIMVSYRDEDNSGSIRIFDVSGSELYGKTIYNTNTSAVVHDDTTLTSLSNGNVFVTYVGSDSYGRYQILDNTGSVVVGETTIDPVSTEYMKSIIDSDNNVFISYADKTNNKGVFVVYSEDGDLLQGRTVFSETDISTNSPVLLNNNNIFVAYDNIGVGSSGSFVIIYKPTT